MNPTKIIPPTNAEIEQALKERHQQNVQVENIPSPLILKTDETLNAILSPVIPVPPPPAPIINKTNTEIEQALKDYESKSTKGENILSIPPTLDKSDDLPGMVKLVIKLSGGLINTQKQAEYVLLGICVLCITITVFLYSNMFSSTSKPTSPVMIQQMKNVNPSTAR